MGEMSDEVKGGTTDQKLMALVTQEKARRAAKAEAEKEARRARRAAAVAAREAACREAAAPAAAALRFALKEATYKLPELERVLVRLEEIERPATSGRALVREAPAGAGSGIVGPRHTPFRSAEPPRPATARAPQTSRRPAGAEGRGASKTQAWGDFGGSSADGARGAKAEPASRVMELAESAIFVHFIPPPLRAEGKKDLPWIVHTCNGVDGCREARRVSFHSITGFATYESAPPEVAEGLACSCQIANHHLRGYGKVRWEGEHAIVEDEDGGAAMIDARAYMTQSKKLAQQLKTIRLSEKELRQRVEDLRRERDVANASGAGPTCMPCSAPGVDPLGDVCA